MGILLNIVRIWTSSLLGTWFTKRVGGDLICKDKCRAREEETRL